MPGPFFFVGASVFKMSGFSIKVIVIGLLVAIIAAWATRLAGQFVTFGNAALAVNILNFTFMAGAGAILLFGGLLNNKFKH